MKGAYQDVQNTEEDVNEIKQQLCGAIDRIDVSGRRPFDHHLRRQSMFSHENVTSR